MGIFSFLLLAVFSAATLIEGSSYYELLGVPKTADNQEIRKAFKLLALRMHPDKNPNNPDAQEKFLNLKTAYEVLKDQESRKAYDLYGEEGVNSKRKSSNYQNWNFYNDNFGIYDDDPEIITLTSSDFEQNIKNFEFWFIKFYSPQCSHCHVVAPAWRKLAQELVAVFKVAAVNCEEDWLLCRREGVSSYPSFILYPTRERYYGDRTEEAMHIFAVNQLPIRPIEIPSQLSFNEIMKQESYGGRPWLFVFCKDLWDNDCPSWQSRIKLANLFDGLVSVAFVDCSSKEISCDELGFTSATVFVTEGNSTLNQDMEIHSLSYQEIAKEVLEQLPDFQLLEEVEVEAMVQRLKSDLGPDWLIQFTEGQNNFGGFSYLLYRRLPVLLPRMKIGRIDCKSSSELCRQYYVSKFPTFATFKRGGAIEMLVGGGVTVSEVTAFARSSVLALNLGTLNPSKFPNCLNDGHPWLIEFYAPWCPPCMKLLPEFRKASQLVGGIVRFGSLDCAAHQSLCRTFNIRSYPTLVFYHGSTVHTFTGQLVAQEIATFVEDILHPPVIVLTIETFDELVTHRKADEVWLVDFFAPWCGPCNQLAPHWRRLARSLITLTNIYVASVDCVAQQLLCSRQSVNAYPTIRFYGAGSASKYIAYQGYQRDSDSLKNWLVNLLPSSVHVLTDHNFADVVLKSTSAWVVDFYAPWCSPCINFAPVFELTAKILAGYVRFAKVDCNAYPHTCQMASVRAYPSVRFYAGRTGWAAQPAAGLPFVGERRHVEDIVAWLQQYLPDQNTLPTSFPERDEL